MNHRIDLLALIVTMESATDPQDVSGILILFHYLEEIRNYNLISCAFYVSK